MEKHVLIPTDFSKNAWNALTYAHDLYKDTPCTFYLLNAFQLYHFTTDVLEEPKPGEKEYEEAKKISEQGLEKITDGVSMRTDNPDHNFQMISFYGKVADAVKEVSREKNIDLIVMGTKGQNNPVHQLFGSNAVDVMVQADSCPVLVIPENAKISGQSLREIVFATNFKSRYQQEELTPLLDIVDKFGAAVRVLYVSETDEFTEEQKKNKKLLEEFLSKQDISFHTLTQVKVVTGVHTFVQSRGSDMLALYNRKHSFFSGLFANSLVKEIGLNPEVPMLVLKEQD